MTRGRTAKGRSRANNALLRLPAARPLVEAVDHGEGVRVDGSMLGVAGDRWLDPFLDANAANLARLSVKTSIESRGGPAIRLTPGSRIGAVALLSPATRKVAAGLLVKPRFRWTALGAVLGDIGFATEPNIGGGPLVPGSAREVPSWLLAAPVLRRLEGMLNHRKRGFVERFEERSSPRGRVDWSRWAQHNVPSGRWTTLPCRFPDPDDDPDLIAAVRWTLSRLRDELSAFQGTFTARELIKRLADLQARVGPGPERRPVAWELAGSSAWVADALQAMGWIAEERGLGGSRSLDGLSWDLAIDQVWEAWVDAFVRELGPRCGLTPLPRGHTRRNINWQTSFASMRALVPDVGMRGAGRVVWIDAKYKAHLQQLRRKGWNGLAPAMRDAHRADLHQALAYANLEDAEQIDSLLVYPQLSPSDHAPPAIATVARGRRRVRLLLVGLPFGFQSLDQRDRTLTHWRELLAT